jgi:UPF0755 protein
MKSVWIGLFSILTICALVVGFVGAHFLMSSPSESNETIVFEVQPGQSFTAVAQNLNSQRLINSTRFFRIYAQVLGVTGDIKVGEYALKQSMKPGEVMDILKSGQSIRRKFVVTEGLNIFEIAELYEKQGFGSREAFVGLVTDPVLAQKLTGEIVPSLEGFLFPETYELTKYTKTEEIIALMVQNFKNNFAKVDIASLGESWTPLKVITLASIIEKETGAPEERPQISAVFHNRLKKGMMLQTDPTIIYGMAVEKKETIYNITREDIRRPTPYNTYTIKGLPPGPISNPGLASLQAAVSPANVSSLFFVSRNDGTHVFSDTYAEHEAAVVKFQKDPAARAGKSWRDLNSKSETGETTTN